MMSHPVGIFVTIDLDLYVADYSNNRVQLFRSGERNGTAVAGNIGSLARHRWLLMLMVICSLLIGEIIVSFDLIGMVFDV